MLAFKKLMQPNKDKRLVSCFTLINNIPESKFDFVVCLEIYYRFLDVSDNKVIAHNKFATVTHTFCLDTIF